MPSAVVVPCAGERPLPVTGHKIVCSNENGLILVGGWNPDFQDQSGNPGDTHYVRTVWKWNSSSRKWTQLHKGQSGNEPVEMASHSVGMLNKEKIIMFGGSLSPLYQECSNRVHIFHLKQRIWQEFACEGANPPMHLGHWFGQAMFMDHSNRCLYVASGFRRGPLALHRLTMERNDWRWQDISAPESDAVPQGRVRHEIVLYNNEIFVIGGGLDFLSHPQPMDTVPVFSLTTSTWHNRPTHPDPTLLESPPPMSCFGCVLFNDSVYISGGLSSLQVPQHRIWKLHLPTLTWSLIGQLPFDLWFHSADVTPQGLMYIFGGCLTGNYTAERSDEVISVWLKVPKLVDIAWGKVLGVWRGMLLEKSDLELRELGLPQCFVQRLRF